MRCVRCGRPCGLQSPRAITRAFKLTGIGCMRAGERAQSQQAMHQVAQRRHNSFACGAKRIPYRVRPSDTDPRLGGHSTVAVSAALLALYGVGRESKEN